jgi:hypothetical protein
MVLEYGLNKKYTAAHETRTKKKAKSQQKKKSTKNTPSQYTSTNNDPRVLHTMVLTEQWSELSAKCAKYTGPR